MFVPSRYNVRNNRVGAQLAIDITLVSPRTCAGAPAASRIFLQMLHFVSLALPKKGRVCSRRCRLAVPSIRVSANGMRRPFCPRPLFVTGERNVEGSCISAVGGVRNPKYFLGHFGRHGEKMKSFRVRHQQKHQFLHTLFAPRALCNTVPRSQWRLTSGGLTKELAGTSEVGHGSDGRLAGENTL